MPAEKKMMERYPSNRWFKWHNANPFGKITGDCTTRALAVALDVSWEQALKMQFDVAMSTGLSPESIGTCEKILKAHGFERVGQPRFDDGRKVSFRELFDMAALDGLDCLKKPEALLRLNEESRAFCNAGSHHCVAVAGLRVHDIWDSSQEKVGVMWVKF